MTTAEMLAQVDQTISDVMTAGQSYTLDGQTFTRPPLSELYKYKSMLEKKIARENGRTPRESQADFRYSD